jgi:hypothetical protein
MTHFTHNKDILSVSQPVAQCQVARQLRLFPPGESPATAAPSTMLTFRQNWVRADEHCGGIRSSSLLYRCHVSLPMFHFSADWF